MSHPPEKHAHAHCCTGRKGILPSLNAWYMRKITGQYNELVGQYKRQLLGDLSGTVVEIGPGTGANFVFYNPSVNWVGIEPSLAMQAYLLDEAKRHNISANVITGVAESIDLPDESADAVVSTLVLCSVDDPDAVLAEIRRVLKPGGRFVFLEHVAAGDGTSLRRWQDRLKPIQKFLAEGCHVNRETWKVIEGAGFSSVSIERVHLDLGLVSPHIMGFAVK